MTSGSSPKTPPACTAKAGSIRQVADKLDRSYGAMRRILRKHVALRNRNGTYASVYREDRN